MASDAGAPRVAGVIVNDLNSPAAKRAKSCGADLLEVRVDTFKRRDAETLIRSIERLKAGRGAVPPLIITVRSKAEGGLYDMPDKERLGIFKALIPFADMVDIELSSGAILKDVVRSAHRRGKKVIVSYHNFRRTPGVKALSGLIKKARAAGADIVKIAALASGGEDLKSLTRVLLGHRRLIVIAMGECGVASRVFFPMLGSLITYGSITAESAPGQLPLKTIKKELRLYGF